MMLFLDTEAAPLRLVCIRYSDTPTDPDIDLSQAISDFAWQGAPASRRAFRSQAASALDRYPRARRTRADAYLP